MMLQRNGEGEKFLRDVFGFLKRRSSFLSQEGVDKKVSKLLREFMPASKVSSAAMPLLIRCLTV